MLPEVILFSETEDTLCRDADLFVPDIKSLIVVKIYRRIQAVGIQTDYLCQELPAPGESFFFEVISEGEVAEHLKESSVAGCFTDILDVACTDTLLACGHSLARRDLGAGKVRFERCHTCIDQKEALVPLRNQ